MLFKYPKSNCCMHELPSGLFECTYDFSSKGEKGNHAGVCYLLLSVNLLELHLGARSRELSET